MIHTPYMIAICGVKNSGKTTFIEKMIPLFKERDLKIAVIKHDGHRFCGDVPGTDTDRFLNAGADLTVVFDSEKYMMVEKKKMIMDEVVSLAPNADLILLEGFKNSGYDKLEVIRDGNSDDSVCSKENLKGIITDIEGFTEDGVPVFPLNNPSHTVDYILKLMEREEEEYHASSKLMIHGEHYFFGPGIYELLCKIEEAGSIRKAAMEMNLSYTKAWKMVNRTEAETGMEFLIRNTGGRKGGSSLLTDDAKAFLDAYQSFCKDMETQTNVLFQMHFSSFLKKEKTKE